MKNFLLNKASVPYYFLCTFIFLVIVQLISASKFESLNRHSSQSQSLGHISELDELHSEDADVTENFSEKTKGKLQRHRRYSINQLGPYTAGFLIVTPIIIILPSMTNLFNKWRKRRSVSNEIEEDTELYQDSQAVENHLNKIATYFSLLEIPETSCHIRAICEFSAEQEKFYPLSSMILRRLRDSTLPSYLAYSDYPDRNGTHNHTEPKSLYKIYNNAADIGQAYGLNGCQQNYGNRCRYSMDKLLNLPVLRFWSGLADILKLSFEDDDASF